jgi:hypothetical protein
MVRVAWLAIAVAVLVSGCEETFYELTPAGTKVAVSQ